MAFVAGLILMALGWICAVGGAVNIGRGQHDWWQVSATFFVGPCLTVIGAALWGLS